MAVAKPAGIQSRAEGNDALRRYLDDQGVIWNIEVDFSRAIFVPNLKRRFKRKIGVHLPRLT
jgi:hypothetical protein